MTDIITRHRPKIFDEIIGQEAIVRSIKQLVKENKIPHAIILNGPSGVGKTSLLRILSSYLVSDTANILEIDAATNGSVEDVRNLIETVKYASFGDNPNKVIIIDEFHALGSKAAFTSLLKTIEEPPSHVFFMFATTDLAKIPKNIQTRCHVYNLKDVRKDDLCDLIIDIAALEQIKLPDGAVELLASAAEGSPRKALVLLSQARNCKTRESVVKLLESAEESSEVIDLCKLLVTGNASWKQAADVLKRLKEQNAESVRIVIVNYFTACLLNAKNDKEAARFLAVLETFNQPTYQATGISQIALGVGSLLLGE